jgi:hypothetical protein
MTRRKMAHEWHTERRSELAMWGLPGEPAASKELSAIWARVLILVSLGWPIGHGWLWGTRSGASSPDWIELFERWIDEGTPA